ncbi:hypothetical protein Hanom_Chr15g01338031 [Helianthus anomalus]
MAPRSTLCRFWQVISDRCFGPNSKSKVSWIRDLLYCYMHRLIATPIAPREESREWCNQGDLFYMYCLVWGKTCTLHRCLAQWFAVVYHMHDRSVLYGGYITRTAISLGLVPQ